MTDKPKRRLWQIHLSTAIVLMLAAGGLLGLNLVPRTHTSLPVPLYNLGPVGIPLPELRRLREDIRTEMKGGDLKLMGWPFVIYYRTARGIGYLFPEIIPINVFIVIIILYGVVSACEWMIRRREARTP